jgi:DNA-binding PadR family transcriptional regulator
MAGHPGVDGAQDAGGHGPPARLRNCPPDRADQLAINHGTLYPVLLKLEQEGSIASEWGTSENNRKARYYRLTRAGKKQLESEARDWNRATDIVSAFLALSSES